SGRFSLAQAVGEPGSRNWWRFKSLLAQAVQELQNVLPISGRKLRAGFSRAGKICEGRLRELYLGHSRRETGPESGGNSFRTGSEKSMKGVRDSNRTLRSGFLRSSEAFPNRPALEVGGEVWSYRRLHDRAACIAATL